MFVLTINLSRYWHFVQNLCSRKLPVSFSQHPGHLWRGFTRILSFGNYSFTYKWELASQILLVPLATRNSEYLTYCVHYSSEIANLNKKQSLKGNITISYLCISFFLLPIQLLIRVGSYQLHLSAVELPHFLQF